MKPLDSEAGFILWEVLVTMGILSVLLAVAIPQGNNMLRRGAVEHEALCLMSDLRLAQDQARTATESVKGISDVTTGSLLGYRRRVRIHGDGYQVFSYGTSVILRRHACPAEVRMHLANATYGEDIDFNSFGRPSMGATINITLRENGGRERVCRQIIIDPAGRIRLASP
ncbi:MAG: prepilin-type N-terminal cleavage/methylation domain-containing protein [Selenomonadaceae bacterium]|nr:prepilin-type N-terminal cleavage/methylation domain-containing protein [Selenomonadaceae bacterium]